MSSEVMLFSPLYLPDGSTNHQLIRIKFYSSWHGVSEQYYFQFYSYWQCQKCCLMTFFFLFFFLFLFININRMKSGRIRNEGRKEGKKEGRKKCAYSPAQLKAAVTYMSR